MIVSCTEMLHLTQDIMARLYGVPRVASSASALDLVPLSLEHFCRSLWKAM